MVVCGLNVTVLCGLGEVELEGVGEGRSGDVSVEVEDIAGMRFIPDAVYKKSILGVAFLWSLDRC